MKQFLIVILIVLVGALVWYGWPIFTSELNCYDAANQSEATIQFRLIASGWSKRQVCEAEFAKLDALNTCVIKINEIKINTTQKCNRSRVGKGYYSSSVARSLSEK